MTREEHRLYQRAFYNKNKHRYNENMRKYRAERVAKGLCRECSTPRENVNITLCSRCNTKSLSNREALVREVYNHYGAKCVCCGESNPGFLTLDHKNNDGAAHRKVIGKKKSLNLWAKQNNYPDILQLLCYNCNLGKARNGGVCPHYETS